MPAGPIITPSPETAARHLRILSCLAEAGLDIALDLKAQIHAATPPPPEAGAPPPHPFDLLDRPQTARASADLALAFARVSRAVRLSIALHDRLAKGEPTEPRNPRVPPVEPLVCEDPAEPAGADTERACRERLSDRERLDVLLDRPVEELIAGICADLGLSPDWAAREANTAFDTQRAFEAEAPTFERWPTDALEVPAERSRKASDKPYGPSG